MFFSLFFQLLWLQRSFFYIDLPAWYMLGFDSFFAMIFQLYLDSFLFEAQWQT